MIRQQTAATFLCNFVWTDKKKLIKIDDKIRVRNSHEKLKWTSVLAVLNNLLNANLCSDLKLLVVIMTSQDDIETISLFSGTESSHQCSQRNIRKNSRRNRSTGWTNHCEVRDGRIKWRLTRLASTSTTIVGARQFCEWKNQFCQFTSLIEFCWF